MGFYKQREGFFEGLAEAHPLVRHNQLIGDGTTARRQSFFRMNTLDDLEAACKNWIHFPCIVHLELSGSDINKEGSIRQRNVNTLAVLTNLQPDPENPVIATALTDAYDITLDVVMELKKAIRDEYEANEGCGVFKYLDEAFGKWERYGPVADNLYGWLFNFSDETKQVR